MNRGFRDLVAFKRGMEVVVAIYSVTEAFPKREMYGLVAQLRRAAIGIISHIGEGDGRITYGERRQFLSQSRGSLCEVEAQILAAHELNFLGEAEMLHITKLIHGTGRAITGLIKWVQRRSSLPRNCEPARPRTRFSEPPERRSTCPPPTHSRTSSRAHPSDAET